jgi:hypothetical protein
MDMPALDFACFLGRLTDSKITGVFLENLVADEKPVLKATYDGLVVDWEIDKDSPQLIEKKEHIEKNITLFKQACENRSVRCTIRRDSGDPTREIINESRYADVIVLDAATSFNKRFEGFPADFVKDVLKDVECPVIVAPESFDGIDEIIFTYTRDKSSAFAIKQFSYIFPQLEDKRIILFQVNEKGEWKDEDK